jgi:hypothetical protein
MPFIFSKNLPLNELLLKAKAAEVWRENVGLFLPKFPTYHNPLIGEKN